MNLNKHYGNIIWTNHALDRLNQRGLTQSLAYQSFAHPDKKFPGKNHGTTEFQKKTAKSLVTIIATQNEQKEWLVLSCWINPPLPGSIDIEKKNYYRAYKKASFWGKFWVILKRQLGFYR